VNVAAPDPIPAAHAPLDSVDRLLADWRRVRPALDFSPLAIVGRLSRLRAHLDAALEAVFAAHGLTAPGFAVLVTLARLDAPGGVSQRRLMDELGLTSGTVSVRIDRLAEAGLVERRPDPDDRRNALVVLTAQGLALFERVAPEHLENERRLLATLDACQQARLAALLRTLLVEFEGSSPPAGAPRLGLVLAPAHVAMALRRDVGLEPVAGLLVRRVADDGPAAGLVRPGDVLVRAGARTLTSLASLHAALAEAGATGRLDLRLLRGSDPHDVALSLAAAPAAAVRAAAGEHAV
jgi:DNA-binding MarR family transcriptional regulator